MLRIVWSGLYHHKGRFGVVVGIFAYYTRGRGVDSRTVQTFVCMNMSVGLGISMNKCMYLQKKCK
jgi:uncharacterized membrane protein